MTKRLATWIAIALALVLAFAGGRYAHSPGNGAPVRVSDNVDSFNDGFSDSKSDDCAQGFATACEWLHQTK